jgi:hypothetical protein
MFGHIGMWLSLVERLVRDEEVEGSNPFIPTIFSKNFLESGLFRLGH